MCDTCTNHRAENEPWVPESGGDLVVAFLGHCTSFFFKKLLVTAGVVSLIAAIGYAIWNGISWIGSALGWLYEGAVGGDMPSAIILATVIGTTIGTLAYASVKTASDYRLLKERRDVETLRALARQEEHDDHHDHDNLPF
jgi:hypothetical protein